MSTKTELLKLLTENQNKFISGQFIGETLNVSRNAVWKAVSQLKLDGYEIESRTNAGYKLSGDADPLTTDGVAAGLKVSCDLKVFDTVTSTNDLAKVAALGHQPMAFIANRQSQGRGRLGRSFESPGGTGLYMTIALKPSFELDKALYVTMAAAVATCRALEKICAIKADIKWVNDIFYRDKKICGILTEAQSNFETGRIDSLIIGTGVNCFPGSFPEEIRHIAGSVSDIPGSFSRSALAAEIINQTMDILDHMDEMSFLTEYRARCFILGRSITVHPSYDDKGVTADALDIGDDGGLIVKYTEGPDKGRIETLHTGEISISVN